MPTRRGWLAGASSLLFVVAGRLLGVRELYAIAVAGVVLLGGAVLYVRARSFDLTARRRLLPAFVPAGNAARVELVLANRGRRPTPPLEMVDRPTGRFLLGPLSPGETIRLSYTRQTQTRGLVLVGPLVARVTDPFGLASSQVGEWPASTLVVHPRVDESLARLDPSPAALLTRPRPPAQAPLVDGEFHALRLYEDGDDMRQVHWPSSARRDQLVVRQDEQPQIPELIVAIDLRRSVHDPVSLEAAISGGASVAVAGLSDNGMVRVLTTGGADSGRAGGGLHRERILNLLATAGADESRDLRGAASLLDDDNEASLVLVTTTAAAAGDLHRLLTLEGRYSRRIVVLFARAATPKQPDGLLADYVVCVGGREPFALAWERALRDVVIRES